MIYLYAYTGVSILVSLRLGYYMFTGLDKYDWHYDRADHLLRFLFCSCLWPLLLRKPMNLITPKNLFKVECSNAAVHRERDYLWNNPPPGGTVIRFNGDEGQGFCEFDSADVEAGLREILQQSPQLKDDDEGALLKWIAARDETVVEPTKVPGIWRFEKVADHLIRSGRASRVYCSKCKRDIELDELVYRDDHCQPGWNYNRVFCPERHALLKVETMHFQLRRKSLE